MNRIMQTLMALTTACTSAPTLEAQPKEGSCMLGVTQCEGDAVRTCEQRDGTSSLSPAVPCAADERCVEGHCLPPSETQQAHARAFTHILDTFEANSAVPDTFDFLPLREEGLKAIYRGDDSDLAYVRATWKAFLHIPQGHQSMYLTKGCGALLPFEGRSHVGACVVASQGGYVVTVAKPGNPLGLSPGDFIDAVGPLHGQELYEELKTRPMCGNSAPSEAYRRAITAASFFDLLAPGEQIQVTSPQGVRSTKMMVKPSAVPISCRDPFDRNAAVYAEATRLPDGTALIRVPQFVSYDSKLSTNPTTEEFLAEAARFQGEIRRVFDSVKDAPRMIWDIRGNSGGTTTVGLAIVSGMPGARADVNTWCTGRIARSVPRRYAGRGGDYKLTPGGDFAYQGKVAILIDGLDYSAADYFPYFAQHASDAVLVGSESAGAFGSPGARFDVPGSPNMWFVWDRTRCMDGAGTPLEGHGVIPHIPVNYLPADLAAGKDSFVERAIQALQGT